MRNIKTLIAFFFLSCCILPATARRQAADSLFQQGCRHYAQGNYAEAIQSWETLQSQGLSSGELYYNLGNAYYRQEQYAQAILNYERARRLLPRDKELKENLALAYSQTQDKIPPMPGFILSVWWQRLLGTCTPQGWRWVAVVFLLLTAIAVVWFALAKDYSRRKASFLTSLVLGIFLLFSIILATSSAHAVSYHREAVVMAPLTVIKSAPDRGGVDKYVLHEGTHLYVDEESTPWCKVHMADGNSGWLPAEDIEII